MHSVMSLSAWQRCLEIVITPFTVTLIPRFPAGHAKIVVEKTKFSMVVPEVEAVLEELEAKQVCFSRFLSIPVVVAVSLE